MMELKDEWLQGLKEKRYETRDDHTGQPYIDQKDFESQYLFMDSRVLKTYQDFVMTLNPQVIPAFTDMVQEWCRENGSLLANEGTGKLEFREKMLSEALKEQMKEIARHMVGTSYAAALDDLYKDKEIKEIFGSGGARFDQVFAEAVAKTDSELLRHKMEDYPTKDMLERLTSREGMWDNIHKNACVVDLSQKIQDVLKDATVGEGEEKQKAVLDAVKKQTSEWKKERPRMKELEKNKPGTIKECVNKAIDLCKTTSETNAKLKETVDKAFFYKLNKQCRKAEGEGYQIQIVLGATSKKQRPQLTGRGLIINKVSQWYRNSLRTSRTVPLHS